MEDTTMTVPGVPDRTEAVPYYFTYIDKVPPGDVRVTLAAQLVETKALLAGVTDEVSLRQYEPGKWTLRQVMSHINDTERLFVFRAMWFARGFDSPLPSFDQDAAVSTAAANERSLGSHLDEFETVRRASVTLFGGLPDEAWSRRGVASGNPVTVRALSYITAGHLAHHLGLLREHYL